MSDENPNEPDALAEAIRALNTTMQTLIERLDVVGGSNDEIKLWRRRATHALRGTAVALVVVALSVAGVIFAVWRTAVTDDDRLEEKRVSNCQQRNESAQDTRQIFLDVFAGIEQIRGATVDGEGLRDRIRAAADDDVDCNRDGRIDERDYETAV